MSKLNVKVINFNKAYEPPKNKYNKSKGFVEWGEKNNYPDSTFERYNYTGSSTSKSIINKKNALITGNGFEPITDPSLQEFVDKTKLEKTVRRIGLDYEIINGFALEVIWDKAGEKIASIKHVPIHKLRIGIECEERPYPHFLFSNDWSQYRKEEYAPIAIREFNPHIRQGKQIFVYYEYNPYSDVYPVEQYSNCMNWIEMDYEISRFHINQLKQGYHPTFVLNFATGVPSQEEIEEFTKDFERSYQGTKNAGNMLLTFSDGAEEKPELIPINLNDSDDRFAMLMEQSEIQIARGHEVPVQMVVTTPGKLSGTDERMELMEEFQMSYVTPRQRRIETVLNELLSVNGFPELRLAEYGADEEGNAPTATASDKEAEARAQLRGSVGGVQGIIQIQESVAAGTSDRAAAQALLEYIYGFPPDQARRLLGDVQEGEAINNLPDEQS